MSSSTYDYAIIGGGIVGLATALNLLERKPQLKVIVLEKENALAAHQTGNNSGVIHSGLYYKPGSSKAKTCVEGRKRMIEFCREHKIAHDICGKIVVATDESELPKLAELFSRAKANGVENVEEIGPERMREIEPNVRGVKALWVPGTGIVDYVGVAKKYGELITAKGSTVQINTAVWKVHPQPDGEIVLATSHGDVHAKGVVNCCGLHSDRVAKLSGANPGAKIVPFRGEYYKLKPESAKLVRNLIYPVPDPRFPFLGVHFTRMIAGGVECGPNAVLAFKREGYTRTSFNLRDSCETLTYGGFWRMASKYWRMGMGEMYRSFSKAAFVRALQKLLPEIQSKDLEDGGAGVRAQALLPDGALVDDFKVVREGHAVHVLNAPSPAATASLSIGEQIAEMAEAVVK
jgi:L-2-hydroxyglutarate oxidase